MELYVNSNIEGHSRTQKTYSPYIRGGAYAEPFRNLASRQVEVQQVPPVVSVSKVPVVTAPTQEERE